jgi:hypothetical protein
MGIDTASMQHQLSAICTAIINRIANTCCLDCLFTNALCPAVDAAAAALIQQLQPDIVVCGHSHKACCWQAGGVAFINPGSAGAWLLLSCQPETPSVDVLCIPSLICGQQASNVCCI